jgi:hypothetical protein
MQDLGKCCSERLDSLRKWIGLATLRMVHAGAVPEEFQAEPMSCEFLLDYPVHRSYCLSTRTTALIIRVLYRLRSLSEQALFDAATFSYSFPLLAQISSRGGVGAEGEDDPLEQIALALDIIKFHCGECWSSTDVLMPVIS